VNGRKQLLALLFAGLLLLTVLFSSAWAGVVDQKNRETHLSGVWVDMPYVAERNCYGLLLLFPDHKFAMAECLENRKLCRKTETIGEWTYRGKVLKLAVTKRAKCTGKWKDDEDQGKGCYYEGVKPVVKTFSAPSVKSFSCMLPAGAPDLSAEYNSDCWEMSLNGKRYWKFNAPIEAYCGLISLAAEICRK
jgi:hypothetical protein